MSEYKKMSRESYSSTSRRSLLLPNGQTETEQMETVSDGKTIHRRVIRNGVTVTDEVKRATPRNFKRAVRSAESGSRLLLSRRLANRFINSFPRTLLADRRNKAFSRCVAVVRRCSDDKRVGSIVVTRKSTDGVRINVQIRDSRLKGGKHGFHLHEGGDASKPECTGACAHYSRDPATQHGGLLSRNRHSGDFGNVVAKRGVVDETIVVDGLTVEECVGRMFIVHEDRDDEGTSGDAESLKTGNSGARVLYALSGRSRGAC